MAASAKRRKRCFYCGAWADAGQTECAFCLTSLKRRRFAMTKDRLKLVHALARQKGLDDETYRLRLGAVGVGSAKELKRDTFQTFMDGLKRLPDRRN